MAIAPDRTPLPMVPASGVDRSAVELRRVDDVEQPFHTSAQDDPDVRGTVDLGARHGAVAHDDEVLGRLAGVGALDVGGEDPGEQNP